MAGRTGLRLPRGATQAPLHPQQPVETTSVKCCPQGSPRETQHWGAYQGLVPQAPSARQALAPQPPEGQQVSA